MILTIRTDKPEAELGLYDKDCEQQAYETWQAHRQLAETIHLKIDDMLKGEKLILEDLEGVVVFAGPGSYTGLRIGMSVANALAYSYDCLVSATSGENWQKVGIRNLLSGKGLQVALPDYGAAAKTTSPSR